MARPAETKAPVIIQMFEWNWDSLAAECTNFIGPAGYGFVQGWDAIPEHIQGSQWWTDYQPVSYTLTSKRGNRSQFANMVSACHNAGVKVIVDTIWNHMAGVEGGTGVGGSSFTHYNYPGIQ
ncbi:glycoside hydrolase [Auricularia subglabra TFB-10046 SS5]|nr:glycoside hydrolase [Auricularia subglabra TFB-10046 SS5]